MNAVLKNIKERRSIRAFQEEPIAKEKLQAIVEAGAWAPTARNTQSFQLVVLSDTEKIAALSKAMGNALGNPGYNMYYPTALIIAANDPENGEGYADCSCALQNIFLAAHSLEVGSVWLNQLKDVCNDKEVRSLLDSYGLPSNYVVWGAAGLGYTDNLNPPAPERKVVIHYA
ncbi:MAG: nitroreductase family protein [Christensenellaceae bacterium]|jgi:nitroreductase